jgi:hypothetical protein
MQLIHHPGAHLHQPMSMPQQLPQVPVGCVGNPYPRKAFFDHQPQQQLCILPIRLLLAHSLGANLGRVPDPQLKLQLAQQTLKPARVPAGFHTHTYWQVSFFEFAVELLGFFAVSHSPHSPVSVAANAICWKPG